MKSIAYAGTSVQFLSTVFPNLIWSFHIPFSIRIAGALLASVGVILSLLSVAVMRNDWRAGFNKKQDIALVTIERYIYV